MTPDHIRERVDQVLARKERKAAVRAALAEARRHGVARNARKLNRQADRQEETP